MTAAAKTKDDELSIFDDADAMIALVQRSFSEAAAAAVAENDRLAIPTHGAIDGKLVVRPPKAKTLA